MRFDTAPSEADDLCLEQMCINHGDPGSAEAAFRWAEMYASTPSPVTATRLGVSLLLLVKAEEALPLLQVAAEAMPTNIDVKVTLLGAPNRLALTERELQLIMALVEQGESHAILSHLHGEQLVRAGHLAEGAAFLRKAMEMDPSLGEKILAAFISFLAAHREYTAAVTLARRSLAENFDDAGHQDLLTHVLIDLDLIPVPTTGDAADQFRAG